MYIFVLMDNPERFQFSVIYPLYNEEDTIQSFIDGLSKWDFNCQVILVNDGSTDRTKEIAESQIGKYSNVYYIGYKEHKGVGAAIRSAIPFCKGSFVTFQDTSKPVVPQHFKQLFLPLVKGSGKAAYGCSFYDEEEGHVKPKRMEVSALTKMTNKLYNQNFEHEESLFKAYDVLTLKMLKLESTGIDLLSEITVKLCNKGIPILKVPSEHFNGKEGLRNYSVAEKMAAMAALVKFKYIKPNKPKA